MRRGSLSLVEALGSSAPGCACNMSIPIRMWIRFSADGRGARPAVSRYSLPAREPESAEGDAPAAHQEKTLERIAAWRETCPELGHPLDLHRRGSPARPSRTSPCCSIGLPEPKLSRVGCFKYENVDGAAANALPGHVPEAVKAQRYDRLMRHQQAISTALLATRIGKTIEVIVDEVDKEKVIARSYWDAPEIDGNVYLPRHLSFEPGDRLMVTVEYSNEYDLWADPVLKQGAS